MPRATVGFLDENGNFQPVKASRPLPTSGGGGGGGGGGVQSVNGDTGPAVELVAADVGAATPEQVALKISYPNEAPGQTNRVMLFDTTGKVITYGNAVTTASQGAIPLRTTAGHIILPAAAPTNALWAASKGYVDGLIAGLVTRIEALEDLMATAIQGDGSVKTLVAKTQAEYDAIETKPATTQYTIKGA